MNYKSAFITRTNPVTGESERGLFIVGTGFRLSSQEAWRQYWRKRQQRERRITDTRGRYVQALHEGNAQLTGKLPLRLQREIMRLIPYADPGRKGLLVDRETMLPLTTDKLSALLGINERDARTVLSSLVEAEVLIREDNKEDARKRHYRLNDEIFNIRGRKLKRKEYFTKVYVKKLEEVITELVNITGEKTGTNAIGLLRILTMYFHYQSFYLCSNPNEDLKRDRDASLIDNFERFPELYQKIKYLSKSQLAKLAGIDVDTVSKYLEQLVSAGAILIQEKSNGKRGKLRRVKIRVLVHPDLMFREDGTGNDEYSRFVRSLFNAMEARGGVDRG